MAGLELSKVRVKYRDAPEPALIFTVDLNACTSSKPVSCNRLAVPDTLFEVNFTFSRNISLSANSVGQLKAMGKGQFNDYFTWKVVGESKLVMKLNTSCFVESVVKDKSTCRVFHMVTKVTVYRLLVSIFAPRGHIEALGNREAVADAPQPRRVSVARQLDMNGSSSESRQSSPDISVGEEVGGVLAVESVAILDASSFRIDDSVPQDVQLSFAPKDGQDAFSATGSIFMDMGFHLMAHRTRGMEDSSPAQDEKAFNVWFSESQFGTSVFHLHFDSTKVATRHATGSLVTECRGSQSARRREVIVANCRGMKVGALIVDFTVTRSVTIPREDDVYASCQKALARSSAAELFSTENLDNLFQIVASRYPFLLSLGGAEVDDFYLLLWSSARRCLLESAHMRVGE